MVKGRGEVLVHCEGRSYTHPPVFCAKSVESIDNTGDAKFAVAKECVTV